MITVTLLTVSSHFVTTRTTLKHGRFATTNEVGSDSVKGRIVGHEVIVRSNEGVKPRPYVYRFLTVEHLRLACASRPNCGDLWTQLKRSGVKCYKAEEQTLQNHKFYKTTILLNPLLHQRTNWNETVFRARNYVLCSATTCDAWL